VILTQTYINQTNMNMNVHYEFPISQEVVFSDLEAIFKGRLIKGVIKPKQQAKVEF
jgi:hypothetical protein